ncbi:MAG: hypothetical protein MI919_15285 [Holophagales bacterium]|nr:hypothetical protein [Holophagales bacterium]
MSPDPSPAPDTDGTRNGPSHGSTEDSPDERAARLPLWKVILLWLGAVLIMFSAVIYQRRTGPTYPMRGQVEVAGETSKYRLIRSEETIRDARVALPVPEGVVGTMVYKRFKTGDAWTQVPMEREVEEGESELAAYLPAQPAAGKLEYYLRLEAGGEQVLVPLTAGPGDEAENIIIRFKDPVPLPLLVAHVTFMFFSVLIGMRTGLGALFAPSGIRRWAWVTFIGMTIGGMILGPFVQKYAFGEYWTGFPWGYDLTDNKMLIMWVVWLVACTTLGTRPKKSQAAKSRMVGRLAVGVAALVMTVVYLIPHSMRGSELDYSKVDQGVPPAEAIGTGD